MKRQIFEEGIISLCLYVTKGKNEDGVDIREEKNIWRHIQIGMRWRNQGLIKKGLIYGGWFFRIRS